jgi:hypothetical protein
MPVTGISSGRCFLDIVPQELHKLKSQGERAIVQLTDDRHLHLRLDEGSNSIDILVRHLAGNMVWRWTNLLTTQGEKPTRNRDAEFEAAPDLTRSGLMVIWEKGWACLFDALAKLTPETLQITVTLAGKEQTVMHMIVSQFSHYANHVGQIIFLAKHLEWSHWQTLSVPRKKA